jgi:hypothetical protein
VEERGLPLGSPGDDWFRAEQEFIQSSDSPSRLPFSSLTMEPVGSCTAHRVRDPAKRTHIECCDSSPSQHATKHAAATGHPIITSFEPVWSCFRRMRIPKISPCLDPPEGCQLTGNCP